MPRKALLTKEQDKEVSRLYLQGQTQRQLARTFNVNASSIETSLKRTATPARRRGFKAHIEIDLSKEDDIINDYQAFKSLDKLSKKYGSVTQLKTLLRNRGVLYEQNKKIEVDDDLILELYTTSLTFKEIQDETGFSQWCIGKSLKGQNIDTLARRTHHRTDYQLYRAMVNKFTRNSWKKYRTLINPNNVKRGRTQYHLDHKYSTFNGFKNSIPPFIIGHWTNLQMLLYINNIKKLTRNHKTRDKLFEDYYSS